MRRTAQTWSLEFIVVTGIFMLTVVVFFYMLSAKIDMGTNDLDRFAEWLMMHDVFNDDELTISELLNLSATNCSMLKADYSGTNDWCIYFKYKDGNVMDISLNSSFHSFGFGCKGVNISGFGCNFSNSPHSNISYRLNSNYECQPDCTMNDGICHSDCHNKGGCNFNNTLATEGPFEGDNIRAICDMQKLGWEKQMNSSSNWICCDMFSVNTSTRFNFDYDKDITYMLTKERYLKVKGVPARMFITVWTKN